MTRILLLLTTSLFVASCQELDRFIPKADKTETAEERRKSYSYACLDSSAAGNRLGRTIGRAGDVVRDLAVNENKITDEVQSQYGAAFHQQMVEEQKAFKLWNDPRTTSRLQSALVELLRVRPNPSEIKYQIYALEDTAVNAFTFGGRIYVTRGMLRQIGNSKALLYAIIGHEIGHSEEGHIKKTIQSLQLTTNIFGEANAGMVMQVTKLLTASFNQRNELEADYYGIELTHRAKQDVCSAVAFWREMASNENRYSQVEDFFRTHPFSSLRAQCLQDHISANYNTRCGSLDKEGMNPQVLQEQ